MDEIYVDPVLYRGRPSDENGRLPKELEAYDLLDTLHIPFERADHEPADTIAACEAVERVIGQGICKNLFLCDRQQTRFYLLLLPGGKPFKTKYLSHQIDGPRLSFAGPEAMEQYLNVTPGSVSPLGLLFDREKRVRLLIDREVADDEFIRCHPCINTSTLKFAMSDFLGKLLPYLRYNPTFVELPREL